jgi:hypothetical protein
VAADRLRCGQTTRRSTVGTIAEVFGGGDFYPDEPIACPDRQTATREDGRDWGSRRARYGGDTPVLE